MTLVHMVDRSAFASRSNRDRERDSRATRFGHLSPLAIMRDN